MWIQVELRWIGTFLAHLGAASCYCLTQVTLEDDLNVKNLYHLVPAAYTVLHHLINSIPCNDHNFGGKSIHVSDSSSVGDTCRTLSHVGHFEINSIPMSISFSPLCIMTFHVTRKTSHIWPIMHTHMSLKISPTLFIMYNHCSWFEM